MHKDARPKNNPKNVGIIIIENGINIFKFSSNVREEEIQYVPERKKPIPNK